LTENSDHELDLIYSVLTPKIQSDLSDWYGRDAKLAGAPTFQPRDWSYFFYFPVQISNKETKTILVKIRHAENMSLAEAIASPKMKEESREEYDTLSKIREVFTRHANASLFATIRPLARYDELNAVVEEMADIRTLRSHFQTPLMWVDGNTRRNFESHMNSVGRWLRIFHDHVGQTIEAGPYISDLLYKQVQDDLGFLEAANTNSDLTFVRGMISSLYQTHEGATLPYRTLHNDFSSANIFVTSDGRICSFDSHNLTGPMYIDIAKIMTDLETCRIQLLTGGRSVPHSSLNAFFNSFLNGYFCSNPADRTALNFYRLVSIIEKWRNSEENLNKTFGAGRFMNIIGMVQFRRYYIRLLRRRIYEQKYGT